MSTAFDELPKESESDEAFAVFADRFKSLRTRLFVKQVTLSYEVRCTEAAISYWESGRRLPHPRSMERILSAFGQCGATSFELDELRGAWHRAIVSRAVGTQTQAARSVSQVRVLVARGALQSEEER